jgi:membrane-bound serine protease (ClpP class)
MSTEENACVAAVARRSKAARRGRSGRRVKGKSGTNVQNIAFSTTFPLFTSASPATSARGLPFAPLPLEELVPPYTTARQALRPLNISGIRRLKPHKHVGLFGSLAHQVSLRSFVNSHQISHPRETRDRFRLNPSEAMTRLVGIVALFWLSLVPALAANETVSVITIDGAIGPATADYVSRAIDEAARRNSQCLVIRLNTPGGLLDSMEKIVQKLLGSPVPVVVYVSPIGGTAASAGCFITLAADIAAMAPATTIGAAHPVSLGLTGGEDSKSDPTMTKKVENFAASYIQAIAAKRSRNVEWAETAVRDSASITAEKARELKVVEIIAPNLDDLLRQLDGRMVNGKPLKTSGAQVSEIKMSAAESIFQAAWRPEVMFLLLLIAMYGIVGEITTPGAILPGVAGAIALVLALYMAAILPVNVTGLLLIATAVALFIIDAYASTHGVLTAGGIVSFFIGSLMLFDPRDPVFRLSLQYIIPGVVLTAAFFVLVVGKGVRAQRLPIKVGKETMIGKTGSALTAIDASGGKMLFEGEYWNAVSEVPVQIGEAVLIKSIEGLTAKVAPKA